MFALQSVFARIINGYEKDIDKARLSIRYLRQLLEENPHYSRKHRRTLEDKVNELTTVLVYHHVTDTLLSKFKRIAPELYSSVDCLSDHKGRMVDVYVKFIPRSKARIKSFGLASFGISHDGNEICLSEYGENSVSVNIWILNNSLAILSHEFGHLQYIIPNLKGYTKYYEGTYVNSPLSSSSLGHDCTDAGGRTAARYEGLFRSQYRQYVLKDQNEKIIPFSLLKPARQRVNAMLNPPKWEIAGGVRRPATF